MDRIKHLLNFVVLAVAAGIVWHELRHPRPARREAAPVNEPAPDSPLAQVVGQVESAVGSAAELARSVVEEGRAMAEPAAPDAAPAAPAAPIAPAAPAASPAAHLSDEPDAAGAAGGGPEPESAAAPAVDEAAIRDDARDMAASETDALAAAADAAVAAAPASVASAPAEPDTEAATPRPDAAATTGSAEADPNPSAAPATAEPGLPAEAVAGDGTATCPPDYPIKGNASSQIYHAPGRASYDRTIAEFCFANVAAAENAGFRPPKH